MTYPPEKLEEIRKAFYDAYIGPKKPRHVIISDEGYVFIAKQKINYKKFIPRIMRDLFLSKINNP